MSSVDVGSLRYLHFLRLRSDGRCSPLLHPSVLQSELWTALLVDGSLHDGRTGKSSEHPCLFSLSLHKYLELKHGTHGCAVVEALRSKPQGQEFDSR